MSDSEKLLTVEEQDACQKITASGGLASQRAAALLAMDQGATRAQASEQTGLTSGQIGYLLRAFRQKHLGLFPDAEAGEAQPAPEAAASEPEKDEGEKKAKKGKKPKGKKPKGKKPKGKKPKGNKGKKDKAKKKSKESKKGKKAKAKKDNTR
ncbi:MAG: helix-turn-helix domain-containing protein [Anaerolineae bacterium]|nr:helix-turn-helix domain-containing protein [Anaerolineae bacterium]